MREFDGRWSMFDGRVLMPGDRGLRLMEIEVPGGCKILHVMACPSQNIEHRPSNIDHPSQPAPDPAKRLLANTEVRCYLSKGNTFQDMRRL